MMVVQELNLQSEAGEGLDATNAVRQRLTALISFPARYVRPLWKKLQARLQLGPQQGHATSK